MNRSGEDFALVNVLIDIYSAIEAILFAAGESVPVARLSLVLDTDEHEILRIAADLAQH